MTHLVPRAVSILLLVACLPALGLDNAVLLKALQFPSISFNLDVSFPIRDIRIPPSADPSADIARLRERLRTEDSPDLHLQLARLLLWTGDEEQAIVQFRVATDGYVKLLEQDPSNAEAHIGFAEVLIATQEDAEAAQHIEEAFIADDKLWRAHELASYLHSKNGVLAYNEGIRWLMESHFAAAETEARTAMELAPNEPMGHLSLFLSKWLPALLELRENPSEGMKQLGRYEEISELLRKGASLAPKFPKLQQHAISCKLAPFFAAQMVKGIAEPIWADLDDQQRRILTSCRDGYIELTQTNPELRAQLSLFAAVAEFMMGNRPRMYELLEIAAAAEGKSTGALQTLVGFLVHDAKWPEALKAAEELQQRDPSGIAYTWLGRVYGEQGKWKQAEEAFRVALSYEDVHAVANLGLGIVLLKSGADPQKALQPLQAALAQLPGDPEMLVVWGIALVLNGRAQEGTDQVSLGLAELPQSPVRTALAKELRIPLAEPQ